MREPDRRKSMEKNLKVITRPLSISGKALQDKISQGYLPLTFSSEIVRPFHAFVRKKDLEGAELNGPVEFDLMGETFQAKFSKSFVQGLLNKHEIYLFEIVEAAEAMAIA